MSIGEELAGARGRVGLTVSEVSERTRIRASIIRDIERDDFGSCAGDFYARGHIRAIARVVGADPGPLIEQYDEDHQWSLSTEMLDQSAHADTVPDVMDSASTAALHALRAWARGSMQALKPEPMQPAEPSELPEPPTDQPPSPTPPPAIAPEPSGRAPSMRMPRGRPVSLTTIVALGLVAAVGVVVYLVVAGSGEPAKAPAAILLPAIPKVLHPSPARSTVQPAPTPAVTQPVSPLTPASAVAFGPAGTSQGDNPQLASLALAGSTSQAWHTNWYTTADFGGLQQGTGLLLDMGRDVTITTARLTLGDLTGADLQLRAGNRPMLADLYPVAQARDAGGSLLLQLTRPVRAQYLLIWFTKLPPDSSGTFEAWVSDVRLSGTA